MIRFLLKSVFWLSLAFIVMPRLFPTDQENGPSEKAAPTEAARKPDSIDQLLANGKTAVEIGKLCLDNPSFCESGTSVVSNAGSGLLEGSRVVLEYLSDRFGSKPQPSAKAEPAIPLPTPREEALRMIDRGSTGAIHR
ncbi:hypothetical protein FHS76_003636 [Ochrobactrum daejeonense]|uniref:Uncharacterized protein n=1 Tax=Brucella daejeonensis TaxID=659015 RepID=A0A7W9EPE7_9HYPH|nr:hypothetical protein [Brucella daejeonensis]MBB5703726.1 hypothetical protein [Brucella daejeonensis]